MLLRVAEDRGLIPEGSLDGLRNFQTAAQAPTRSWPHMRDALYADDTSDSCLPPSGDPGMILSSKNGLSVVILRRILSTERRYDCGIMPDRDDCAGPDAVSHPDVRRSATHQAIVVDTHETVVSGRTGIAPLVLIDYMVRQALVSARKHRSSPRDPPAPGLRSGLRFRHGPYRCSTSDLLENTGGLIADLRGTPGDPYSFCPRA